MALAILERVPVVVGGVELSVYRLATLPLLLAIVAGFLRDRRFPWVADRGIYLLLLGLLVTMGLSALGAEAPSRGLVHLLRYVEYAAIAYLLAAAWMGNRSPVQARALSMALALSAFVAALSVLSDFVGWTAFYQLFEADQPYVRHVGILGEANYAGAKLAVLMPFVLHEIARAARLRYWPTFTMWAAGGIAVVVALFVTGSRMGGALAIVPVGAFLIRELPWLWRPQVWVIAGAIAGLLVGGIWLVDERGLERAVDYVGTRYALLVEFLTTGEEELGPVRETSLHERFEVFQAGLSMMGERPLLGVGVGQFPHAIGRYSRAYDDVYSHNTYLSAFAETGLVGGLIFLLLCARVLALLVRGALRGGPFAFYLLAAYVVLLLGFGFLHALEDKYFWTVFVPLALAGWDGRQR
ncbi:MAG: O-antigen ligase family protein [Salinibacter sp.]